MLGLTLSTEFMFGVSVGVLLVLLSKPLTRLFSQAGRYLPLLLLILVTVGVIMFWLGR